jgi:hypothetical protein
MFSKFLSITDFYIFIVTSTKIFEILLLFCANGQLLSIDISDAHYDSDSL